jgi:hypothetical protein
MFIRWRRRCLKKATAKAGQTQYRLSAILVESCRHGSKVRQRMIAYLGSIQEAKIDHEVQRLGFWQKVDRRLDAVPASLRGTVTQMLEAVVPRPSEERLAHSRAVARQLQSVVAPKFIRRNGSRSNE